MLDKQAKQGNTKIAVDVRVYEGEPGTCALGRA